MKNRTKLSKRLLKIANLVNCKRVADIGCDHGKLVEWLFENGIIDYAYVSDISEPSVNKAIKLLSDNNRNFASSVADGLQKIDPQQKIEQVVISGMGGKEIMQIIASSPFKIASYVLEPQNNVLELKQWLISHNYDIDDDRIVKDGHMFYNVFRANAVKKANKVEIFDLMFGASNFVTQNLDFYDYLQYNLKKINILIDKVPAEKKKELMSEKQLFEEALCRWEKN